MGKEKLGNGKGEMGKEKLGKEKLGKGKWEILARTSFRALTCVSRLAFASSRYIRFANTR